MGSATLGGLMRKVARDEIQPACREGRISKRDGNRVEVAIRSLLGDAKTLPARGYQPHVVDDGGLELLHAVKGDPVWVTADEGGQLVIVAWEPKA